MEVVLLQSCQEYSPALIQIFQMKCNLYTRWETAWLSANTLQSRQTHRGEMFYDVLHGVQKTENIFMNIRLLYLFSHHLGLLVNLLPIGHITQEVVALGS